LKKVDDDIQKILVENNMNIRCLKNIKNNLCLIVGFEKFYSKLDEEHKEKFKEILNLHKSYKQTYELTFKELKVDQYLIDLFSKPNFTLAYQYYKAIKTNHKHINFSLIKRTNSYDNEDLSCSIVSAKAIRKAIYEKIDCNKYLPFEENIIDLTSAENILLNIINYKVQIDKTYSETINSEGIINYIFNNIKIDVDYKTTINNLCNKRYTISRIRRHLLYLLLNINEFYHNSTYLRILGIDKLGLNYISTLDKTNRAAVVITDSGKILLAFNWEDYMERFGALYTEEDLINMKKVFSDYAQSHQKQT
jgi:predicted nucleotidyltransferase